MLLGFRFHASKQVSFAHDADHLSLVVHDRDGADAILHQVLGDLADFRVNRDREHLRCHHVLGFHRAAPSQARMGPFLVCCDERAIANHVGAQDGGDSPLNLVRRGPP